MKLLKQIFVLTLLFLVMGPLLLLVESKMVADLNMMGCAVQILLMATAYWAYTLLELYVISRVRQNQPNALPGVFIGFKGGRLLLSFLAIILYGILNGEGVVVFSVNLLLFYLVTMLYNSVLLLKDEKKTKLKA
jgi:hypothetical protein